MQIKRMLLSAAVLALGASTMFAATRTYGVTGNTGTATSGPDCFGASNQNGDTVTVNISSTAKPTASTATTATYNVPKGAISGSITTTLAGTVPFTTSTVWKMEVYKVANPWIKFSGAGPDASTITVSVYLAKGSITAAWLKHPGALTSQALGAKSTVAYVDSTICGTSAKTIIPISGTVN